MGHSLLQGCRQDGEVNKTESAQVTRTVAACASDLGPHPCGRVPCDLRASENCCGNQIFADCGFCEAQKKWWSKLTFTVVFRGQTAPFNWGILVPKQVSSNRRLRCTNAFTADTGSRCGNGFCVFFLCFHGSYIDIYIYIYIYIFLNGVRRFFVAPTHRTAWIFNALI